MTTLGILGTGQIVRDAYLPVLPFIEEIEELRLYDKNVSAAERMCQTLAKWIKEGVFEDNYGHYFLNARQNAEKLLEHTTVDEDFDTVVEQSDNLLITTPPGTHATLVERVARAGKQSIVEKPLSTSRSAYEQAVAGIERKVEKHTFYLDNFLFNPAYTHLKEEISKGSIGDLMLVEVCLANTGPSPEGTEDFWRINPAVAGGGVLYDWGPHTIGLARYLAGSERKQVGIKTVKLEIVPAGCRYIGQKLDGDLDIESVVRIDLGGSHPTSLLVENSWKNSPDQESENGRSWVRVEGTEGSYVVELKRTEEGKQYRFTKKLRRQPAEHYVRPVEFPHDSFFYGVKTALSGRKPDYATVRFGLEILDTIEEILERK